jgi:hypothetical protein
LKSAIKLALNGFISGQVETINASAVVLSLQDLPNFLSQNGIKDAIISSCFRAFQWLSPKLSIAVGTPV